MSPRRYGCASCPGPGFVVLGPGCTVRQFTAAIRLRARPRPTSWPMASSRAACRSTGSPCTAGPPATAASASPRPPEPAWYTDDRLTPASPHARDSDRPSPPARSSCPSESSKPAVKKIPFHRQLPDPRVSVSSFSFSRSGFPRRPGARSPHGLRDQVRVQACRAAIRAPSGRRAWPRQPPSA